MKKLLLTTAVIFTLIFTIQGSANAMGLFYTNAVYPITATGTETPDLSGLKKGSSSTNNILFLVETGNASIDAAAKKAGIKKISYVDMQEKSVFIFWRQLTINVYGE